MTHPLPTPVVRTGGQQFPLIEELSLEGPVRLLVDDHLFNWPAIANQRERIHRNRILQSHKRTPAAGQPTISRL